MDRLSLHVDGRDACRREYGDLFLGRPPEVIEEGRFGRPCLAGDEDVNRSILQEIEGSPEFGIDFDYAHLGQTFLKLHQRHVCSFSVKGKSSSRAMFLSGSTKALFMPAIEFRM